MTAPDTQPTSGGSDGLNPSIPHGSQPTSGGSVEEALAEVLRKSRLMWGLHSDRWLDGDWQRGFWREAVETLTASPEFAALVRDERAAAWDHGYARGLRDRHPGDTSMNPYRERADREEQP